MNWKHVVYIFIICFVFFSFWFYQRHPLTSTITIANTTFDIELAITPEEKTKGLGYRDSLFPKHGMVFPYDHKERFDFWMKGMKFPLDFIWIADTSVVDITKNVQPPNGLDMHVVHASVPVNKILEINAGEVEKYNIQIGDSVTFNK